MKIFLWLKRIRREYLVSFLNNVAFMKRKIKFTKNENHRIMNQSDFFQNNLKSEVFGVFCNEK